MSITLLDADTKTDLIIPIRFHIVSNLSLTQKGVRMESWVTKDNIRQTIIPELNHIWEPSGITFEVENTFITPALECNHKHKIIDKIVKTTREDLSGLVKRHNELIDFRKDDARLINIYFVPYMAQTIQGVAIPKISRCIIGQYSDKSTRAQQPPIKRLLTEPLPFKKGSISRTIGHEVGHILGLDHPDKASQKIFHRLMGGRKHGYRLTEDEVKMARKNARKFSK